MSRHPLVPQSSATTSGEVQRILGKLEGSGRDIEIARLMANWSPGFRPFILMADALLTKGVLAPQLREVCILHIAARRGLDYEWNEHVTMSVAAGVTDEQRQAILDNRIDDTEVFDDDQRQSVRFINEILTNGRVRPNLWDQTIDQLGFDQTLELVFVYAWWGGFAAVATEVLVPLTKSNEH